MERKRGFGCNCGHIRRRMRPAWESKVSNERRASQSLLITAAGRDSPLFQTLCQDKGKLFLKSADQFRSFFTSFSFPLDLSPQQVSFLDNMEYVTHLSVNGKIDFALCPIEQLHQRIDLNDNLLVARCCYALLFSNCFDVGTRRRPSNVLEVQTWDETYDRQIYKH